MERVRKLVVSAAKQSGRVWFPECSDPIGLDAFMQQPFEGDRYLAHCREGEKVPAFNLGRADSALVLIGPEGDFSRRETELAFELGFVPLSLGSNRLRTETAALTSVIAFELGEPVSNDPS